ncbi:MAG: DUF4251 domain-containing protein, partial [Bacteroidetes bacterium]|nr:DUF4251 domain-containing protein [Bacteroidota bacterium]
MNQVSKIVKKSLLALSIVTTVAAILPSAANAQSSTTQSPADKKAAQLAAVKDLVESQNYVFKAQTVMPMAGSTRQLTSDYSLKVTKENIVSYLPYFGRAYTAPMDPSKGGIQFTSKDFDYTLTPGKKQGWTILIKPKDYRDVQQMTLSISSAGYATLQVTSTNRQPISFNGQIVKPSQK